MKKLLKGSLFLQIVKGTVEILRKRSPIRHFECFFNRKGSEVSCFHAYPLDSGNEVLHNFVQDFFIKHLTRAPD